eukprot:SAG22_NODE_2294_length_2748_cov_1.243488_3_plen_159_part_00
MKAAAPGALPVQIPPGWAAKTSRTTGEVYFVNEETGESTWELPSAEGGGDGGSGGSGGEGAAAGGWTTRTSQSTGDTYYFNTVTGATQWDPPSSSGGGGGQSLAATAQEVAADVRLGQDDDQSMEQQRREIFDQSDQGGKGHLDAGGCGNAMQQPTCD